MAKIASALTLKSFNPEKYPNPALQWHYRILQAIALDEELPEQPEDKTLPKYNAIHKRVGPLVSEWGDLLNNSIPEHQIGASAPKKRKIITNGKDDTGVDKKIKSEKKDVEATSADKLESLFEQGNL